MSVTLSEAEVHWRAFFHSLVQHGLCGGGAGSSSATITPAWPLHARPSLAPSPGNAASSTSSKTPRLTSHVWSNGPKSPAPSAASSNALLALPPRCAAEQRLKEIGALYAKSAPKLVPWLEENLPQGFTVFMRPTAHQKRLRTSNALERLNQELKRRTRVARVFPNETSLLRLISTLLAETSDDWETGKIYLSMECQNSPSV